MSELVENNDQENNRSNEEMTIGMPLQEVANEAQSDEEQEEPEDEHTDLDVPVSRAKEINQKTLDNKIARVFEKIERHLTKSFLANFHLGNALNQGVELYIASGKTVEDFEKVVAEKYHIGRTTSSNLRRVSKFLRTERKDIMDIVLPHYLRSLDGILVRDFVAALDAKEKGKVTNLDYTSIKKEGIFLKFFDSDDLVDLVSLTTRGFQKRLEPVGGSSESERGIEYSKTEEIEPTASESHDPEVKDQEVKSMAQNAPDTDVLLRYQIREKELEAAVEAHCKREQELLRELEAAKRRAEELEAELELLRAQSAAEKGAV